MSLIKFRVDGVPVPKQSFRYSKTGGYTDPRVEAWQWAVTTAAKQSVRMGDLLTCKLGVRMIFYLPDHRRRDLDNLSKAVLDACNMIIWKDDTQVAYLELVKFVADDKRCGVEVEVLDAQESRARMNMPYILPEAA
jgi:Holliday junction resolvase RusA-like endonuclease